MISMTDPRKYELTGIFAVYEKTERIFEQVNKIGLPIRIISERSFRENNIINCQLTQRG